MSEDGRENSSEENSNTQTAGDSDAHWTRLCTVQQTGARNKRLFDWRGCFLKEKKLPSTLLHSYYAYLVKEMRERVFFPHSKYRRMFPAAVTEKYKNYSQKINSPELPGSIVCRNSRLLPTTNGRNNKTIRERDLDYTNPSSTLTTNDSSRPKLWNTHRFPNQ